MLFHDSFFDDAEFLACTPTISRQGATTLVYPDEGEQVRVLVKPFRVTEVMPDGRVMAVTIYRVTFQGDPTGLNAGNGVRLDDKVLWKGVHLVAQGPTYLPCTRADRMPLWRVDCIAKT